MIIYYELEILKRIISVYYKIEHLPEKHCALLVLATKLKPCSALFHFECCRHAVRGSAFTK